MSGSPYDEFERIRRMYMSGIPYHFGDDKDDGEDDGAMYSWVAGLQECPKCKKSVAEYKYYCEDCSYGEKGCTRKKPPKIEGYDWVVTGEHPEGHYFMKPSKDLFETVIIEDYKKQMIVETLSLVEHGELIFKEWGFGKTLEKGYGISMLFWGPPGTGKTLMGEAIAQYLGKELQVVTASEILDKYVGESEKRLTETFAKYKKAVILFDECDSLLFSRENARNSWQISQVNVLLHELEKHQGVTLFTTNHAKTLDPALDRRIALKVKFDIPSAEMRKQIWQRMFPKEAPLAKDIDWDLLASFEITGGYVKNAVLRAARIAAFRKAKEISFATIKEALKQELQAINDYQLERGEALPQDQPTQTKATERES